MLLSNTLLQSVLTIAEQAGQYLCHFYNTTLSIHNKEDNTPVTNADLFVSQFLIEKLSSLSPHLPVLSEESCNIPLATRETWSSYWLVDPLDGTRQFINKTGQFSVLISLVHNNIPVLGVIYSPILGRTFYAMKGFGAFKKVKNQITQLAATPLDLRQPIKITIGSLDIKEQLMQRLNPQLQYDFSICGSSGVKSTLVAENSADCYIRIGKTGEWDTAVADILLAEIGGTVLDFHSNPLTYNKRESLINPNFIMVSNKNAPWDKIFNFQ